MFQMCLRVAEGFIDGSNLVIYGTHLLRLAIIVVDYYDFPEFLCQGILIWLSCRFYFTDERFACIVIQVETCTKSL